MNSSVASQQEGTSLDPDGLIRDLTLPIGVDGVWACNVVW